jgi:hypothetical protein
MPTDSQLDSLVARRLVALALLLGVVGEALVHGVALGVNVPIVVTATIVALWLVRPPAARLDPLDRWIGPAAIGFALMVALRADDALVVLDTVAALGLTVMAAVAVRGEHVTRRTAAVVADVGLRATVLVLIGAAALLHATRPALPEPGSLRRASPVIRGLALALPIVVIFALLFASADAVFERLLGDLVGLRIDLGDAPTRMVVAVVLAWLAAGLFSVARSEPTPGRPPGSASAVAQDVAFPWPRIGAVEASVVVAVVDLLFALFVGLQVAYLFGGHDTLDAAGLTYSDYARRGFFELVAAAALAGGLIAALDQAIKPRSRWFVGLALALVALTAIVLASAALRLRLYQEAYGWTELRFYVYAAIGWLGLGLASAAVLLLRDRMGRLGHALAGSAMIVAVAVNLIGPTAYVAARNVERALDPSLVPAGGRTGFDASYGAALGDDAIPAFVAALPRLTADEQAILGPELRGRWIELRTEPALTAPAAWNLGRERARSALEGLFGR